MLEALFSKINRSAIVKRQRERSGEEVHSYLEDFDEEPNVLKRIFHLPSEPVWYYSTLIMGSYNILVVQLAATQAIINPKYMGNRNDLFHLSDLIWLLDIAIRFASKFMWGLKTDLIAPPQPKLVLYTVEFIGILPIEYLVSDHFLFNMLALNRNFKIVHILHLFSYINSRIHCSIIEKIIQILFLVSYVILLTTILFAIIVCGNVPHFCKHPELYQTNVAQMVAIVTDQISLKGAGLLAHEYYTCVLITVLAALFSFISIFCLYTAQITFSLFSRAVHKSNFKHKLEALHMFLRNQNMNEDVVSYVDDFYDTMWRTCNGYEGYMAETRREFGTASFKHLLPSAMLMELHLDVFWGAFSHSQLFKEIDLPALRELSTVMKMQCYTAGQYVYHKDEMKDKMIYVYSGVIQIISEENGETPLLSLADGTCLGEISILMPHKVTHKVKCQTVCVLQVLEREPFLRIILKYPHVYKQLNKIYLDRFKEAVTLHEVKLKVNSKGSITQQKCMSVIWINHTLHLLMSMTKFDTATKHAVQNVYLQYNEDTACFKNMLFSARYLSLLAITERVQVNSDIFFIKSTFPYIFRPNTGLILFWDIIIAILSLIAGLYIPASSFVPKYTGTSFRSIIYIFTVAWWIDVIVQLRIAVKLKHRVISKPAEIFTYRLSDIHFLYDVYCAAPIELLSSFLVSKERARLVFFNRAFKLLRVFQLLLQWEKRFNSNPLKIRLLLISLILFYGSYITACIYSGIECLDPCDGDEFFKIVYYTGEKTTGGSQKVVGYTDLDSYKVLTIFTSLLLCSGSSIFYGVIFSAYAFTKMHMFNLQHITQKMVTVAKYAHRSLIYRIKSDVQTQSTISNGLNFFENSYIFNSLPKPVLGYCFNVLNADSLVNLPIFRGLLRHVVVDILQNCAALINVGPGETLFNVGDLTNNLKILDAGVCECVSGVGFNFKIVHPPVVLNDLEVIMSIPCRSTVITATNCNIFNIDYVKMKRVLYKYYPSGHFMSGIVSLKKKILEVPMWQPQSDNFHFKIDTEIFSIIHHQFKGAEYRGAFYRHKLKILRYILLPITFSPDGRLCFVWEYIRCVCAFLSATLYLTSPLIFTPVINFLYILSAMSILDLYFRMHVCYYDSRGILITHPLYTALNYWNNGFFIDALAALPTEFIVVQNRYIFLTVNRALQIHRYFSLLMYYESVSVLPPRKIFILKWIPVLIIILNFCASLYLVVNCRIENVEKKGFSAEVTVTGGIFNTIRWVEVLTPLRAHIYSLYVVVTTVTTTGFQGFVVNDKLSMVFILILSAFGFFYNIVLSANIFGYLIHTHLKIINNDMMMHSLFRFMTKEKVRPILISHVEGHVKRAWYMLKYNVHDSMLQFPHAIQRDLLFERYGRNLVDKCLINSKDMIPFVRNLLFFTKYQVIGKYGYVITVNDVMDETIILYSGIVEVVSPTGHAMLQLMPGSIIGNLCPIKFNRIPVTIIAIGTVELLYVKSTKFFELLEHFPSTKSEFEMAKAIHQTHIPGFEEFQYRKKDKASNKWMLNKYPFLTFLLIIVLNLFGSFLSQILFTYMVSVQECSSVMQNITAATDVCFIISVLAEFFFPVFEKRGLHRSLRDIGMYWLHSPIFWISVIAALPLQLCLPYVTCPLSSSCICYSWSRIFVPLRSIHFFSSYKRHTQRFNINIFRTKLFLLLSVTTLIVFYVIMIFLIVGILIPDNMNKHISFEELRLAPSKQKFREYVVWFYVITNMLTRSSQYLYFPISLPFIIFISVLIFVFMIFTSYFFASIIAMVQATRHLEFTYSDHLNHLYSFLNRSEASQPMVDRITFYASVTWRKMHGVKYPALLDEIPIYLKEAILGSAFGYAIDCHPIFGKCHKDFRRQLVSKLKVEYYYHGDYVQFKGMIDNTIYWVHQGHVIALSEMADYTDDVVMRFKPGDSFGMPQGIFDRTPHIYSYRTILEACVLYLERESWEHLMIFYPASKQIILTEAAKVENQNIGEYCPMGDGTAYKSYSGSVVKDTSQEKQLKFSIQPALDQSKPKKSVMLPKID